MDIELKEIKKVTEKMLPGGVALGSVLGCRTVLNQPQTQAYLVLKTRRMHELYKLATLAAQKSPGHTTPQEERFSADKPRGDWSCPSLPGGWETAHLRSMACEEKTSNPLPVSPYSPKILIKTSASVPASMTSPVYTLISYLLPKNEDKKKPQVIRILGREEQRSQSSYHTIYPSLQQGMNCHHYYQ